MCMACGVVPVALCFPDRNATICYERNLSRKDGHATLMYLHQTSDPQTMSKASFESGWEPAS